MSDGLQIIACPNPFRAERRAYAMPAGLTVGEILQRVQPRAELMNCARVFIDAEPVPADRWDLVQPRPGQMVTVRMVPAGGGGKKNPLGVILSIAMLAATPWLGVQLSGALNLGLVAGRAGLSLATMAVGIAGQLLVQAIAPPPQQRLSNLTGSGKDAPTYSIGGGRNRLAPYASIPQVLGRHLVIPPYGAPPYTELVGQDQYMRFLFILGYGPLTIEEPKIGETSLWDYQGVEMESRHGYPDDGPLTLFPGQVQEEGVGATLSAAADWVTRTTAPDCEEIGVEIAFAQGLVRFDEMGERQQVSVEFEAQYRPVGGEWRRFASEVFFDGGETQSIYQPRDSWYSEDIYYPVYRTDLVCISEESGWLQLITGAESQTSATTPATPARHHAICRIEWASNTGGTLVDMRSALLTASGAGNFAPELVYVGHFGRYKVTVAPGSFLGPKVVVVAKKAAALRYGLRLRVVPGQYDVRLKRVTPDSTSLRVSDEATWAVLRSIKYADPITIPGMAKIALRIKATDQLSGIIDQFSVVCQSICNDWDGAQWVQRATSNPAALARHILQGQASSRPLADARLDLPAFEDLAEACTSKGWQFNAAIERQTTTAQLLGDILAAGRASRGMRDGLYSVVRDKPQSVHYAHLTPRNSWDERGEKAFTSPPHALRVRYTNAAAGWRQDEVIVYADGYSALNASRIEDLDLYGITGYQQAWSQGRYYMAVAKLRPEIHSRVVDFEHLTFTRGDLIRVTCDVSMHGILGARIKQVVTNGEGQGTALVVDELCPMEDGKTYGVRVRRDDGSSLYRAVNTVAGESDTLTFSSPVSALDLPAAGDLLSFGESDRETAEKLVTRIDMLPDLAARVYYVDAAPAVHTADTGPIPPYDPQITRGADLTVIPPAVPVLLGVVSDDRALVRRSDGTIISRILVAVSPGAGGMRTDRFELAYREAGTAGAWQVMPAVPADAGELIIDNVEDGTAYALRLRALSAYGAPSTWVETTHTVIGKTSPPPDPDVFLLRVQADGTREFTARVLTPPPDFAGYLIRYRLGTDWTWDDMQPLHDGVLTTMPWETNLLAAGDYVFGVRAVDTTGNLSAGAKYIETTIPDPRLAGVLDMFSEFGEGWPGTKTSAFVTTEGHLSALDADTWGDKTAWADWTRWNQNPLTPIVYQREHDIGVVAAFVPQVSVQADGAVTIEEQHSDDGSTWSAWAVVGALVTCRHIRIRVTVAGSYPLLRDMQTLLTAKPRTDDIEDLDTSTLTGAHRIGVGDIRLPIAAGFAVVKRVEVTLQNVGPGWSWELIDKNTTTGPRIRIYNGSNTLADAVIDATIRGI